MKGVSEVIAIILILMITIAIAGLAYTFMSSTMASTTSAASSSAVIATTSMRTAFSIENVDIAKVYVRNTGNMALTNLSVYVNDVPAITNASLSVIPPGGIGEVIIYNFLKEGDNIKIVSSNGFTAMKTVTDMCTRAVGCWHFDESVGTTAYDSSPYARHGTLVNGPLWTVGFYGNGLQLDGTNDFVSHQYIIGMEQSDFTWSSLVKLGNLAYNTNNKYIGSITTSIGLGVSDGFIPSLRIYVQYSNNSNSVLNTGVNIADGNWHYLVYQKQGNTIKVFSDGVDRGTMTIGGPINIGSAQRIGTWASDYGHINGTIDEVRIYDRAIY